MYTIKQINWNTEGELAKQIRRKVFIEEQKVTLEQEWDGKDAQPHSLHFVAFDGDEPIGTARLINKQQIGRMAVLKAYRSKKIGSALLCRILKEALRLQQKNDTGPRVILHAQVEALGFYQKHGFVPFGEQFMDAGIPHRPLRLEWNRPSTIEAIFQDEIIRLKSAQDYQFHLFMQARATSRHLDILTDQLNPQIFAENTVVSAVSCLARRTRYSRIRILVRDPKPLHGNNHPLVTLSQRLSSKVQVRVLTNAPERLDASYAIFDERRMVYFNNEQKLEGFANYLAPAETVNHLEEFNRCWEHYSEKDPNLEQLYI